MVYKPEYYTNFKNKNLDKIQEKKECSICGGKYSYYHKSRHFKTIKHLKAQLKIYNETQQFEKAEEIKNKILNNIL